MVGWVGYVPGLYTLFNSSEVVRGAGVPDILPLFIAQGFTVSPLELAVIVFILETKPSVLLDDIFAYVPEQRELGHCVRNEQSGDSVLADLAGCALFLLGCCKIKTGRRSAHVVEPEVPAHCGACRDGLNRMVDNVAGSNRRNGGRDVGEMSECDGSWFASLSSSVVDDTLAGVREESHTLHVARDRGVRRKWFSYL